MHAVKVACIGKVGQVAPDRLQGYAEPLGEVFDNHAALAARDVQYLGLTKTQGQIVLPCTRFGTATVGKLAQTIKVEFR
jgi:hypothetical protein